jgi:hypothetical protein
MGLFDGITGLFSKKTQTPIPTPTQTLTPPPTPYTYMYPGSLVKFKNDPDGISKIYKIDIRENGGKVINPKIFYSSDGNFPPELLKAVDFKIQQQYEYNTRWRDSDGSSPWDNWVPGQPSIPPRGGKRGRKSKKTRKSRKTRKARKSRKN